MDSVHVRRFVISIVMVWFCWVAQSAFPQAPATQNQAAGDALLKSFVDPPQSARPRVWWHWMNGNVSKEGIKLDLEWMHRIGLGGFQAFVADRATPQVVPKRLVFMTPEWKDAFKYATVLADQLGLQEAIAGSPGWSEAGGPWVPAREAMKKYVWSETVVDGGRPFTGKLIHPPSITGPFQNLALGHGQTPVLSASKNQETTLYADSAVVAFPMPAGYRAVLALHPVITASGGTVDAERLSDGDLNTAAAVIPAAATSAGGAWIEYAFHRPQTIRSMTFVRIQADPYDNYFFWRSDSMVGAIFQSSDDGMSFHTVIDIPKVVNNGTEVHTLSFAPVTARFFRLLLRTEPEPPCEGCERSAKRPPSIAISEFALHADPQVNRLEEKAAFIPVNYDLQLFPTQEVSSAEVIRKSSVIDLTSRMHADGTLDWTPPAGKWVVLRIGYSLLGITNHPAPPEATGLEVDKLNAAYVKDYINHYLDLYKGAVGQNYMGYRGIRYMVNDSWEAGAQNWTDAMIADFIRLRGYDPHPWLPVLAGHIVQSAKASDQFLWDFRKTIADLTADEFYGQLETSLKARGMGHYGEAHENGRHFIADGMEVKKFDDIPMGAMWPPGNNAPPADYDADDRESASVAHIYGQNLAAAESLTTSASSLAWSWSPATLKPTADQEFANGINLFAIHESAQQPLLNKAPGMTLGRAGQFFNRNETWAQEAGPWIDYLARSSYLLQQGRFAADILYFYGEDSNLTAIFHTKGPDVPEGYQFDYVNADALIHMLNVNNGRITTASGMSYRLLALDPYSVNMSLPVLRAICKLVEQGAVVAGMKPVDDPSLGDDQAEFNKLSDALFGNGSGVRTVGKGKVFAGQDAAEALKALGVAPDFAHTMPQQDTRIEFVHRKLADGDIYFLDSRNDRAITVTASFRVTGREPELWHADTGKSEPVSYTIAKGRTTIPLHLEPWGTVFVVFRKPATAASRTLPAVVQTQLAKVEGPWKLSFQPGRGAPASIILDKLSSWSDNPDPGVKYFSGTGTYTKTILAQPDWFKPGAKIWIDLGDVKNLADVSVNGVSLGVAWHAPYRVDATAALKPGANQVTIKVIDAWINRLIGDQQPNATKYTFTDITPYKADSPLVPSGLLGPVTVVCAETQNTSHP